MEKMLFTDQEISSLLIEGIVAQRLEREYTDLMGKLRSQARQILVQLSLTQRRHIAARKVMEPTLWLSELIEAVVKGAAA